MWHLRTLGNIEIRGKTPGASAAPVTQPKRLALAAYLAVARPRGFHRRDTLLGLLWPEHDEARARAGLNQAIYHLRQCLGEQVVVGRGEQEVGLDPNHITCDAVVFERAIDESRLAEALDLYSGDLFSGFHVDDAPEFDRWADLERQRFRDLAVQAATRLAREAEAAGDLEAAVRWARRAATLSPWDEAVAGQLILLLDQLGDRAGALRAYDELAERLSQDLEVDPSPETQALVARLRARAAAPLLESTDGVMPQHTTRASRRSIVERMGRPAWLVIALLMGIGATALSFARSDPMMPTLAVLPVLTSDTVEGRRFGDILADAVITELWSIEAVRVLARTSVMRYRENPQPLRAIASELDADYLVELTSFRDSAQVGIVVALFDRQERRLWGRRFARGRENVLTLQAEVARAIARVVQARIRPEEEARLLATRRRLDPEVIDLLAEADELMDAAGAKRRVAFDSARTPLEKATTLFAKVTELEPAWAFGWARLAEAHHWAAGVIEFADVERSKFHYEQARIAAEKAIEHDRDEPAGHAALAYVLHQYEWDWQGALREYDRLSDLRPGAPNWGKARLLRALGRHEESIDEFAHALERTPNSALLRAQYGTELACAGQADIANQMLDTAALAELGRADALMYRGEAAMHLGHYQDAIDAYEKAMSIDGRAPPPPLAYAYWKLGRDDEALEMIRAHDSLGALVVNGAALIVEPLIVGDDAEVVRRLKYMRDNRPQYVAQIISCWAWYDDLMRIPQAREILEEFSYPK